MTAEAISRELTASLVPALGDGEARATSRLLMEDVAGFTPKKLFTDGRRELEPETVEILRRMAARIAGGEPPQYVTGRALFMGMTLRVSPAVLIPRPETEGLVDLITDDYRGRVDLRVMDIGTGSGCIAIALARALPFARVEAVDVSPEVLKVASGNARSLGARVNFGLTDILKEPVPSSPSLDIIVSNPPYIAEREKSEMDSRVLDHEPSRALFVPDDDPLLFYRAIARYGMGALVPGGRLYFEINPIYAAELQKMLADEGYADIEVRRDYVGKLRFARASRA